MSKNKNKTEIHGCIVCTKLFNVLAVYDRDDALVDSSVTSSGGHSLPNKKQVLVACDTHSENDVEFAYKR